MTEAASSTEMSGHITRLHLTVTTLTALQHTTYKQQRKPEFQYV